MTPRLYTELTADFATKPAVNQVECDPFFQQKALREILAKDDVKLKAWYPLGHGDKSLLENPVIAATVCNGKREVRTDNEEAKAYFLELMMSTDGEEHDRAECVYIQLLHGIDECSDEDV